jgi:hypothetical protein
MARTQINKTKDIQTYQGFAVSIHKIVCSNELPIWEALLYFQDFPITPTKIFFRSISRICYSCSSALAESVRSYLK